MTRLRLLFFILMAMGFYEPILGQTMHVIGYGATNDTNIGKGCAIDIYGYFTQMDIVASSIGYEVEYYSGVGDDCNKENVQKCISSLACGINDIVVFYYSGHGMREFGDTNKFPYMCLNAKDRSGFLSVQQVLDDLSKTKARLKVVITDCCNMPRSATLGNTQRIGDSFVTTDPKKEDNYRKLFVEVKGLVAVTSSSAGEYSSSSDNGSIFSRAFFSALDDIVTSAEPKNATWKNFLEHVNHKMRYMTVPAQTAAYLISLDKEINTPGNTLPPTPVLAENKDMAKDIAELLNRTISLNHRLGKVDGIAKKWFTTDARVASMARDGRTVLDSYDSVRKFLQHIAISDEVSRVIILKGQTTSSGKINYIELQEVRTK